MAVTFSNTNKPLNPRGNDASPLAYNRAALYSGKALSFDGAGDYVDCGTLDVTAYTAISMSFNFQLANITDNGLRLVSLLHSGTDDIRIEQGLSVLRIALDDGTAYTLETPSLTANEWNKFDMTFNGSTLEGYINGVSIGSMSASFNFSTANGLLNLYKHSAASSYAEGLMSGFKLFNTALTPAQIADLYNNPEKIVPTGVDNTALKLWLPMMESAGTTAYDGSGNGNHGTISGATYVNGVGAPVAQTSVIDWNKGTNLVTYSEEFETLSSWSRGGVSVTANQTIAPDGSTTGDLITSDGSSQQHYILQASSSSARTISIFVKMGTQRFIQILVGGTASPVANYDLQDGVSNMIGSSSTAAIENYGNDWWRISLSTTDAAASSIYLLFVNSLTAGRFQSTTSSGTAYVWGAQMELNTASVGPYVRTGATAQPTPVLLPAGLTTGRDITGVNLFENVRKQGALNLDGQSWAEVHDNASVDVSEFTLEGWIYTNSITSDNRILSKWFSGYPNRTYQFSATNDDLYLYISDGSNSNNTFVLNVLSLNNWYHCVATYDGANLKIYLDGVLKITTASTMTLKDSDQPVYIGAYVGSLDPSDNTTAQPRIYNRALSAEEIQRNFNAGKNIYS